MHYFLAEVKVPLAVEQSFPEGRLDTASVAIVGMAVAAAINVHVAATR